MRNNPTNASIENQVHTHTLNFFIIRNITPDEHHSTRAELQQKFLTRFETFIYFNISNYSLYQISLNIIVNDNPTTIAYPTDKGMDQSLQNTIIRDHIAIFCQSQNIVI